MCSKYWMHLLEIIKHNKLILNSMKKELLFIIVIGISSYACQNKNQTNDVIDNFFDQYENSGSDKAIDYLFSTNEWIYSSKDQIEDTSK